MSGNFEPAGGGSGDILQIMPLVAGGPGSTSGADDIDVSDAKSIMFLTDCTAYINSEMTATFPVKIGMCFGVGSLTSIHVDQAISYVLA